MVLAVFLLQVGKPGYRDIGHMLKVVVDLGNVGLVSGDELVGLVLVVLQYALHLYLEQTQIVVAFHLSDEVFLPGCELFVEECHHGILVGSLFESAFLVHALFDENAFE